MTFKLVKMKVHLLVTEHCTAASKGKKKANRFHAASNVHCKLVCTGVLVAFYNVCNEETKCTT